jgi:2-phospho-L-lactate guanylyltransferase (CobY/MobA/RfbA family)
MRYDDDECDVVVRGIRVPAEEQRVPRAVVEVTVDRVAMRLTVRRKRNQRLDVGMPQASDGRDGVVLPADLQAAVAAAVLAAVEADPLARAHLQPRLGGGLA